MKKGWLGNSLLKGRSEGYVALNLGNYFIKGLILQDGKVIDYFIEKNNGLPETITKIWQDKKITTSNVRLSLKDPSCLVRYFSFPKTEKKRLQQALFYEMNKFIPFSPEEVYFDFSALKETSPTQMFILLAVAKKDFINKILEVFATLNVEISTITLDSICLSNLFLNNYSDAQDTNISILDVGYKYSTMTIFNKGVPFLTRDVKVNASEIFQVISRIKNIDPEGMDKWVTSLVDSAEFLELAQENVSSLCKEMKNSFDYFEVNSGEHIEKLYITGGLSAIKGIGQSFAEFLDIEVDILESVVSENVGDGFSADDQKFHVSQNAFAVPFGLTV
jgi:type IV pilus assembly protein PilM